MKKMIFGFAILLALAFSVNKAAAQIGIRAGIGFSNVDYVDGAPEVNPDSKIGLSLGLSKEYSILGDKVKLAPEIMFDIKGTSDLDLEVLQVGAAYYYAGAGLGLKVKIPVLPLYALAQPYYQYLAGGQQLITDIDGNVTRVDLPDEYFDELNRSEFGVNLGIGTKLQLGPLGFLLEARYAIPMTTLEEAKKIGTYTSDIKNKYFTVSVGILIGGNKD